MATQLITRVLSGPGATPKNSPLLASEGDNNLLSLNENKLERENNLSDVINAAEARDNISVPSISGQNAIGTWEISITGLAGTATALATPRTINGIDFDGTQNITLATVNLNGNQTVFGVKTFSSGIVADVTGDLVGNVTGDVTGNAGTVTNGVYTVGNQTIGGTKTFSSTINGSISGNAGTVTNGVYTVGNQTIGGTKTFSSTIVGDISGNAGSITNQQNSATIQAVSTNTGNRIVLRDGSGNFAANVITARSTSANFADLAEKYLSDQNYQIGTIISVGGEQEVTATTKDNINSMFGVVSGNPAYLMNESLENGLVVALKGRVPVRVIGKINKGDRITVSDILGVGESAQSSTSNYVGISLENKNTEEEGLVEAIIL